MVPAKSLVFKSHALLQKQIVMPLAIEETSLVEEAVIVTYAEPEHLSPTENLAASAEKLINVTASPRKAFSITRCLSGEIYLSIQKKNVFIKRTHSLAVGCIMLLNQPARNNTSQSAKCVE